MNLPRYALYFAPGPGSALWELASRWLGRDAACNQIIRVSEDAGISYGQRKNIVSAPAHYGFHATLKPPFLLSSGKSEDRLISACAEFAGRQQSISLSGLTVSTVGSFVALCPSEDNDQVNRLAAACVQAFDSFRAAPAPDEIEKRRKSDLTPNQDRLLLKWGYPFVMEEFRFHMTLTDSLPERALKKAHTVLTGIFADFVNQPVLVDNVSLFIQPQPDQPFKILRRFPFD